MVVIAIASLTIFQLSQPTCDFVASVLAIKAFLQALLDDLELCAYPQALVSLFMAFMLVFLLTFCYYKLSAFSQLGVLTRLCSFCYSLFKAHSCCSDVHKKMIYKTGWQGSHIIQGSHTVYKCSPQNPQESV